MSGGWRGCAFVVWIAVTAGCSTPLQRPVKAMHTPTTGAAALPPTWLSEQLARRIERLAPLATVAILGPGAVGVSFDSRQQPVVVYAARAASPCGIEEEFCERSLDRLAAKAIEVAEHESQPLERDRIVPLVVDVRKLAELNSVAEDSMVCVDRPLVGDLRVIYSSLREDSPARTGTVIRQRDLIRLQLDPAALNELAIANVERLQPVIDMKPGVTTRGVSVIEGEEHRVRWFHDVTAALLRDEIWREAAREYSGELVALVLNDHQILVASSLAPRAIAHMVQAARSEQGFTSDPTFMVWNDGWQPFQP